MNEEEELRHAEGRVGETVLGRYELEGVIGVGGLGVVYRAFDATSGGLVAVKIMRERFVRLPTAAARFLREARITQALRHPAIPRGLDTGVDRDGAPVLVMEYVIGKDFQSIVEQTGALAIPTALRLGARVADALEVAHRQSVIHRDIKPANLMLLDRAPIPNGVLVLDFGIAFCLDEPRLSSANAWLGSPEYMSPEQARGEPVAPAADIYSLGATLVHLLTGATMYSGNYVVQLAAHAGAPVPSLRARRPEIPQEVEVYLHAMLDKAPTRRPASAAAVARALAELADWIEDPTTSRKPSIPDLSRNALLARQLADATAELHRAMQGAASEQDKVVRQLVALAARQIERDGLVAELEKLTAKGGHPAAIADLKRRVAALGDAAADKAREQDLEATLARMHADARAVQAPMLETIRELHAKLAVEP